MRLFTNASEDPHINRARTVLQRLKQIPHPGILHVIEGAEEASGIFIITHSVTPLSEILPRLHPDDALVGLVAVASALDFLHQELQVAHMNVSTSSVYVEANGDWVLGNFDVCVPLDVSRGDFLASVADLPSYRPVALQGASADRAAFVDLTRKTLSALNVGRDEELNNALKAVLKTSISVSTILHDCRLIKKNATVRLTRFMSSTFATELERFEALDLLRPEFSSMSPTALTLRLPQHLNYHASVMLEGGQAEVQALLKLLTIVIPTLSLIPADSRSRFLPIVESCMHVPNRAIRYTLLEAVPDICPMMEEAKLVSFMDPILTGIDDTDHHLRNSTIKALYYIFTIITAPARALKKMRKLLKDPVLEVRMNLIVCFSNILPFVTEKEIIAEGFAKCVTDPDKTTQLSALNAIQRSILDDKSIACLLLPSISPLLVSKDAEIKGAAFSCCRILIETLTLRETEKGEIVLAPSMLDEPLKQRMAERQKTRPPEPVQAGPMTTTQPQPQVQPQVQPQPPSQSSKDWGHIDEHDWDDGGAWEDEDDLDDLLDPSSKGPDRSMSDEPPIVYEEPQKVQPVVQPVPQKVQPVVQPVPQKVQPVPVQPVPVQVVPQKVQAVPNTEEVQPQVSMEEYVPKVQPKVQETAPMASTPRSDVPPPHVPKHEATIEKPSRPSAQPKKVNPRKPEPKKVNPRKPEPKKLLEMDPDDFFGQFGV